MSVRLHHTHIFASDLDATIEFYRRWFDADVVADHTFAGSRNVMVGIGDGRLNIYDQAPRDLGRNAVHHIGLQVDGLAALVARMITGGVAFRSEIRVLPELDYIMVEAPDGILLELFEYKGSPDGPNTDLDAWFGHV